MASKVGLDFSLTFVTSHWNVDVVPLSSNAVTGIMLFAVVMIKRKKRFNELTYAH